MPASLVLSQVETLEDLEPDEPGFSIEADEDEAALADEVMRRLAQLGIRPPI
jgi:gluconate kinase